MERLNTLLSRMLATLFYLMMRSLIETLSDVRVGKRDYRKVFVDLWLHRYAKPVRMNSRSSERKEPAMLFGIIPVQNIPVIVVMWGVIIVCIRSIIQDYKDERIAAHIRELERKRRIQNIIEQGNRSRAERMRDYHA